MFDPVVICHKETFLKNKDNVNIKDYQQYNYIHNTELKASKCLSILIRNNVLQSKIELKTI